MKNDGTYFDYIIYTAFQALLGNSNKRELSIKQLHDHRMYVVKQMEKYFEQYDEYDDETFEKALYDFFDKNKNMSEQEENNRIKEFIKNNSDLFFLNQDKICVKKDMTAEKISEKKFELDCYRNSNDKVICGYVLWYFDDLEVLKLFDALDVVNDVDKLYKMESQLEGAYKTYENNDSKTAIALWNSLVFSKLMNIYKHDHFYINYYFKRVRDALLENKKKVDINLLSDELKETDNFYKKNTYIDGYLEEMYYQAIFSNNNLAYEKLLLYLEILETYKRPDFDGPWFEPASGDWDSFLSQFVKDEEFYEDEFDNENSYEEFSDDEDEDDIKELKTKCLVNDGFFLNYINNLMMYQNDYDEKDLFNNEIKRLSYLLNRFNKPIYQDEISGLIESVSLDDINYKEDMYDFYVTARLFIFDLLDTEEIDCNSLKKILYVITYYELTNDKRIKKIVNKYKNGQMGSKIYDAVINNCNIDLFEAKENDKKGTSFIKK